MNRLTTAAVLVAATSMLAVTSAFIVTNFDYLSAKRVVQLAVSTAETKFGVKPRVGGAPAGQCRRLVGVWTTLGFELVIRPDDTAYDPGYGATGTIACVGQTAKVHWLRGNGEDERFTVSADDDRLTQSGVFLGVQYARASKDIPPDRYGPPASPASAPAKPLDLSGL